MRFQKQGLEGGEWREDKWCIPTEYFIFLIKKNLGPRNTSPYINFFVYAKHVNEAMYLFLKLGI